MRHLHRVSIIMAAAFFTLSSVDAAPTATAESPEQERTFIAPAQRFDVMQPALTKHLHQVAIWKAELAKVQARKAELAAKITALKQVRDSIGVPADRAAILACIRQHEGGGYTTVSKTGKYRGAYQMDASFWASYGDGSASTADQASIASQDAAAWNGYLARGYGPWPPSQGKCP